MPPKTQADSLNKVQHKEKHFSKIAITLNQIKLETIPNTCHKSFASVRHFHFFSFV